MVKIGSCLIQHLLSKTSSNRTFPKEGDLQLHVSPSFGEPYCRHNVKTLKAVYPHFAQAKRKVKERSNNLSSGEILNHEELKLAMEQAKSHYETMRDIQEQLNHAYKELMLLQSNS